MVIKYVGISYIFSDVALDGSWESLGSVKMLSQGASTISIIHAWLLAAGHPAEALLHRRGRHIVF